MPRYDYRCPQGHVTEATFPMGDAPEEVTCHECPMPWVEGDGGEDVQLVTMAHRVYSPPAAIHFHGSGFYSTDVNGRLRRRRRPNVGDDLPCEFDHGAAKIADAI